MTFLSWIEVNCNVMNLVFSSRVIGGSRGGVREARPPPGRPNSFDFMQFSGKFGVFTPPLEGSRPPLGKILDPPLRVNSLFLALALTGRNISTFRYVRRTRLIWWKTNVLDNLLHFLTSFRVIVITSYIRCFIQLARNHLFCCEMWCTCRYLLCWVGWQA